MGHYTTVQGKIKMSKDHYEKLKANNDMGYFFNYAHHHEKGSLIEWGCGTFTKVEEDSFAEWDGSELKNILEKDFLNEVFHAICDDPTAEGSLQLVGESFPFEINEMITVYFAPSLTKKGKARFAWRASEVKHYENPF